MGAKVETTASMFKDAEVFNQAITRGSSSSWDTVKVETMASMFEGAKAFNGDITTWDTTAVKNMEAMFKGALAFQQDIKAWVVTSVTNNGGTSGTWMFTTTGTAGGGSFSQAKEPCIGGVASTSLLKWRVCPFANLSDLKNAVTSCLSKVNTGINCCSSGGASCGVAGTADMPAWDVSLVTDMSNLFKDASNFNVDISSWDTAAVTTMASMFEGAEAFNKDIKDWNAKLVESMASMFKDAKAFNQAIPTSNDKWNTVAVKSMASMFDGASKFDQNIPTSSTNLWKTAAVTDMSNMFNGASDFGKQNGNCANWDVNAVTTNVAMYT